MWQDCATVTRGVTAARTAREKVARPLRNRDRRKRGATLLGDIARDVLEAPENLPKKPTEPRLTEKERKEINGIIQGLTDIEEQKKASQMLIDFRTGKISKRDLLDRLRDRVHLEKTIAFKA